MTLERKSIPLDKKEELIASLVSLGVQKNVAKILVFFIENKTGVCQDIQEYAEIRQPAVSMGMDYLRKRGWVYGEKIKSYKRGTFVTRYRMLPLEKIIDEIERDVREKNERTRALFRKIRIMIEN